MARATKEAPHARSLLPDFPVELDDLLHVSPISALPHPLRYSHADDGILERELI